MYCHTDEGGPGQRIGMGGTFASKVGEEEEAVDASALDSFGRIRFRRQTISLPA
jgi:hypothetical protein